MAAIGRFQKGDQIFHAKVVDGKLYKLKGDVFGSPSYVKKPISPKGIKTLTPVEPTKIIAVGLNYADHAREAGHPVPKQPLFWLKAPTSLIPDNAKIDLPFPSHVTWFAIFGLGALSTALAFILYFRVLATAGAVNISLVTFLIPVSAIALGVLFLNERLEIKHFTGMAIIWVGLAIIDGRFFKFLNS